MIDIKVPENECIEIEPTEEQKNTLESFMRGQGIKTVSPAEFYSTSKELHEINKTLKEMLREMRKRKV